MFRQQYVNLNLDPEKIRAAIHDTLKWVEKVADPDTCLDSLKLYGSTPLATEMRSVFQYGADVFHTLQGGPCGALLGYGVRLWLGAFLIRNAVTTGFLLLKLVRKKTTMVISMGTGSTQSQTRRDAWRATVPARDVGLYPLRVIQMTAYCTELLGQTCVGLSLFTAALAPSPKGSWFSGFQWAIVRSIVTARPIRMLFAYPLECFVFYPALYAFMRWRATSSMSKAKVTVTQTVNNYYGGAGVKKNTLIDYSLIASVALDVTGLPWLSVQFLGFRDAVMAHGFIIATSAYCSATREQLLRASLTGLLRAGFYVLTIPLAVSASLTAGLRRTTLVPDMGKTFVPAGHQQQVSQTESTDRRSTLPVLGDLPEPPAPPKNGLVEVYNLPHDVGLELFSEGQARLIGGEALPEIGVSTDERLRVRMPLRPVCNNTFAWDMLDVIGPHPVADRLRTLTKVPANPYRNAVELQKFVSQEISVGHLELDTTNGTLTEREFLIRGLRIALNLTTTDFQNITDFPENADIDYYLTPETKKHHPGWTTRAFGGQTKADAWAYSVPRAARLWSSLINGKSDVLRRHVWLFLGVVKKQASRKRFDSEYRSRGAVIPEQELQLLWTHLLSPLQRMIEEKDRSWTSHYELFHGRLRDVWSKFAQLEGRGVTFVNEDMTDHGASLELPIAEVIAEFLGTIARHDSRPLTSVFKMLFREMISGVVGLPDDDGCVHLFQTSRGMKDGVWGTSFIGMIYKSIGELHKLWRAWHNSEEMRASYPDILQAVKMEVAEIHGDNSLAAYPNAFVPHCAGTLPAVAKIAREIGLVVKPDESLAAQDLSLMYCMSWHMANIGTTADPAIVGWKETADVLKGFFLPERLADYTTMTTNTRDYLGQILISLYILGFWNGESRLFIEAAWQLLWTGCEAVPIRITKVSDFIYKTGLDPALIGEVSSASLHPYPPDQVAALWLGPRGPRYQHLTAPGAPSVAQGMAFVAKLQAMRESESVAPRLSEGELVPEASYDFEDMRSGDLRGTIGSPAATQLLGSAAHVWTARLSPYIVIGGIVPLYEEAIKKKVLGRITSRPGLVFGLLELSNKIIQMQATAPERLWEYLPLSVAAVFMHACTDYLSYWDGVVLHSTWNIVMIGIGPFIDGALGYPTEHPWNSAERLRSMSEDQVTEHFRVPVASKNT